MNSLLRRHVASTWAIAWPVIFGHIGNQMTHIADTVMVGRLGSEALAGVSLSNNVYLIPFLLGVGIAAGITPFVGRANGARDMAEVGRLLGDASVFGLLGGVLVALFSVPFIGFIPLIADDPAMVSVAQEYFLVSVMSIAPYILFTAVRNVFDGMARTKAPAVILVLGNILNVILNWMFIYGELGMPALGAVGAAWATLLARVVMAGSLVYIAYRYLPPEVRSVRLPLRRHIERMKPIISTGAPIALQIILEVGAFAGGGLMIASIGAVPTAAHQIAINIASTTFLISMGIASAGTVNLSNLIGAKKYRQLRLAGRTTVMMSLVFMASMGVVLVLFRELLPKLYVGDTQPEVVALASHLLLIAAAFQLFDGLQVTAMGVLRGIDDMKVPTVFAFIGYWVVTVPISWACGLWLGYGVDGVWWGYLAGLIVASILLIARFESVVGRVDLSADRPSAPTI